MSTHTKVYEALPVAGYVSQSEDKVREVNRNKVLEEKVLRRIEAIEESVDEIDTDLLDRGRHFIEIGFMLVNRAIFQPERLEFDDEE